MAPNLFSACSVYTNLFLLKSPGSRASSEHSGRHSLWRSVFIKSHFKDVKDPCEKILSGQSVAIVCILLGKTFRSARPHPKCKARLTDKGPLLQSRSLTLYSFRSLYICSKPEISKKVVIFSLSFHISLLHWPFIGCAISSGYYVIKPAK